MEDYKPNSNLSKRKEADSPVTDKKEVQSRTQKAIAGEVTVKKQSKLKKFKNEIIAEDAKNIKTYIFSDVLIPAFRNLVWDSVTNALGMLLGRGNVPAPSQSRRNGYSSRISYGSMYRDEPHRRSYVVDRSGFDLDDIYFNDPKDFDRMMSDLRGILEEYRLVRVFDLYESIGVTPPYTTRDYGWTDISGANIRWTSNGYLLQMPRAMAID